MVTGMSVSLVIPAAGSGERLGLGIPKALVEIGGVPLLRFTLERLCTAAVFTETVVLAPAGAEAAFRSALAGLPAGAGKLRVLTGGATRQASVAAGIAALAVDVEIVCVHDAARPLVSAETVRAVLEAARACGAATAASRPSDSVREERDEGSSSALDRARLWLVETPQAFRREVLARAHAEAARRGAAYTDDASLVEAIGQQIRVVASTGRNLKVTVGSDLLLAADLLLRAAERA